MDFPTRLEEDAMSTVENHSLVRMPLSKAAAFLARETGSPKPALSTLIRWATRGCHGVQLRAEKFGARWYVQPASLLEFHRLVNERAGTNAPPAGDASLASRAAITAVVGREWGKPEGKK
ncbi:MAG: hypothetical protein VKK63_11830 [Synechococcus sp.]|nr:hypothetical protein [Synechococcus sp.]